MTAIIQTIFFAPNHLEPIPMFLVAGDVDANDGMGNFVVTNDPSLAKKFETGAEAFDYRMQVSKVKPRREDGQPNRPLAALTVVIRDLQ